VQPVHLPTSPVKQSVRCVQSARLHRSPDHRFVRNCFCAQHNNNIVPLVLCCCAGRHSSDNSRRNTCRTLCQRLLLDWSVSRLFLLLHHALHLFSIIASGGNHVCEACPPGFFAPEAGSSKCLSCSVQFDGLQFANVSGSTQCQLCPYNAISVDGIGCVCSAGHYAPALLVFNTTLDEPLSASERAALVVLVAQRLTDTRADCAACDVERGANCSAPRWPATLTPAAGFYRASERRFLAELHECPHDGACLGGANSTCRDGHRGALCGACQPPEPSTLADGFYMNDGECIACPESLHATRAVLALIVIGVVLGLLLLVFRDMIFDRVLGKRREKLEQTSERATEVGHFFFFFVFFNPSSFLKKKKSYVYFNFVGDWRCWLDNGSCRNRLGCDVDRQHSLFYNGKIQNRVGFRAGKLFPMMK
jgi:hypothetical protein